MIGITLSVLNSPISQYIDILLIENKVTEKCLYYPGFFVDSTS